MLRSDKSELEEKVAKSRDDVDNTIRDYETKIDNITLKYLEKIDKLTADCDDKDDQIANLREQHEGALADLKSAETEISANKSVYERRIEKLEKDLDGTTDHLENTIQGLRGELEDVHGECDELLRAKNGLAAQVRDLSADCDDANGALAKLKETLGTERERHETKLDETTAHFSSVIDEMMSVRKELEENLTQCENELADREDNIDNLTREMDAQRKSLDDRIDRLSSENESLNRNVLDLSSAKMECMDKIRGLEEEVSDADGAIDDAKAAIETLLDEKKAADARIQDLRSERERAAEATESIRKQMIAGRKEQEAKLFKAQAENEELNHRTIVLQMEKREASERVTGLEAEIAQAETAIGDAKAALKKMLEDKDEANRRIESLEEDYSLAQSTIQAMAKSMSQATEEYETKIDSLMADLAMAREVHASRSSSPTAVGEDPRSLVRSETLSTSCSNYTFRGSRNSGNDAGDAGSGARNASDISDLSDDGSRDNDGDSRSSRHTRSRSRGDRLQHFNAGMEVPKGEVTIIYTSVQGSTSLWEVDPLAMKKATDMHDKIVRKCYHDHGGYEITSSGVAFSLAFQHPADAIGFALKTQLSLYRAKWPAGILNHPDGCENDKKKFRGFRVGFGMHHGPATSSLHETTGRTVYAGEAVDIAKAVEKMSHGGQILTTVDTWRAVSGMAEQFLGSPQVMDCGEHLQFDPKKTELIHKKAVKKRILSKRIVQLVPNSLSYDFFAARGGQEVVEGGTPQRVCGRVFPPLLSHGQLSTSFLNAPYANNQVAMAVVYTDRMESVSDKDRKKNLKILSRYVRSHLMRLSPPGYECREGNGSWMLAFDRVQNGIKFALDLKENVQEKAVLCGDDIDMSTLFRVGIHWGPFLCMGPHKVSGHADYFGPIGELYRFSISLPKSLKTEICFLPCYGACGSCDHLIVKTEILIFSCS